jgi:hypothetical protein
METFTIKNRSMSASDGYFGSIKKEELKHRSSFDQTKLKNSQVLSSTAHELA